MTEQLPSGPVLGTQNSVMNKIDILSAFLQLTVLNTQARHACWLDGKWQQCPYLKAASGKPALAVFVGSHSQRGTKTPAMG